jgi:hypothetical protein
VQVTGKIVARCDAQSIPGRPRNSVHVQAAAAKNAIVTESLCWWAPGQTAAQALSRQDKISRFEISLDLLIGLKLD